MAWCIVGCDCQFISLLFLQLVSTRDGTYHVLSGGNAGEDEREDGELHVCGLEKKKEENWIVSLVVI